MLRYSFGVLSLLTLIVGFALAIGSTNDNNSNDTPINDTTEETQIDPPIEDDTQIVPPVEVPKTKINVATTPSGATIRIDGNIAGISPVVNFIIEPGPHSIEAEKYGYDTQYDDVNVVEGTTKQLQYKLQKSIVGTPIQQDETSENAIEIDTVESDQIEESMAVTTPKNSSSATYEMTNIEYKSLKAGETLTSTGPLDYSEVTIKGKRYRVIPIE
jgi:hypothetical protein